MNRKWKTILNLFIGLLAIFTFAPASSSSIFFSYGQLGEARAVCVDVNVMKIAEQGPKENEFNIKSTNVAQIFNIWLLVLAVILFKKCYIYNLKLPARETLVSAKVRMDD